MRELLKNVESLPDIEIARSPQDFKVLAERTLSCAEKVIYYLGSIEVLMKAYEQAYEDGFYIPSRMELGVFVKMLVPESPVMRKYKAEDAEEMRETRALPDDVVLDYSVMLHDDWVVFFLQDPELYGLVVKSQALAKFLKALFSGMWGNAAK